MQLNGMKKLIKLLKIHSLLVWTLPSAFITRALSMNEGA